MGVEVGLREISSVVCVPKVNHSYNVSAYVYSLPVTCCG